MSSGDAIAESNTPWEARYVWVHAVLGVQQQGLQAKGSLQPLKQCHRQLVLLNSLSAGDSWRQLGRVTSHDYTLGTLKAQGAGQQSLCDA